MGFSRHTPYRRNRHIPAESCLSPQGSATCQRKRRADIGRRQGFGDGDSLGARRAANRAQLLDRASASAWIRRERAHVRPNVADGRTRCGVVAAERHDARTRSGQELEIGAAVQGARYRRYSDDSRAACEDVDAARGKAARGLRERDGDRARTRVLDAVRAVLERIVSVVPDTDRMV